MTTNHKTHGRVDYIDRYIGQRVRSRRLLLGYSQEKIAQALDVSIQQVQKYEKGINRISGANLYRIAHILEAPLVYFFEGVEENVPDEAQILNGEAKLKCISDQELFGLTKAYSNILCMQKRKKIVQLIEVMSWDDAR